MISKENIRYYLEELVKTPSISGSKSEKYGARKIYELFSTLDYYKEHPQDLKLIPLEDDFLEREIIYAFLPSKNSTKKTIIITGHYDVVGVEEYGHLQDIAFNIDEITSRIEELHIDGETKNDIDKNDWLFGRGIGDMKYGLALGIESIRYFSEEDSLPLNILFLGVPGEETNSEGMLEAVKVIADLQDNHGLAFISLLNTEAYDPDAVNADEKRYIHIGSSGKIMPLFFFCGNGTHAGEMCFDGVDPNLMSAKLHEFMQYNTDFCQESRGKTTPPPSCLKMGDLKDTYSITTPIYSISYYNIITLHLDVEPLVSKLKSLAAAAFEEAIKITNNRIKDYEIVSGQQFPLLAHEAKVVMFNDLYKDLRNSFDGNLDDDIKVYANDLYHSGMELQNISINVFKKVIELHGDKSPKIVIGFIPPYCPDNYPDDNDPFVQNLRASIDAVIKHAKEEYGESLEIKEYYMGLSDMCYVGLNPNFDYEELFENIVGIGNYYKFPVNELKRINIPSIIFGPYVKDVHKATERINISYSFDILPELFINLIKSLA